jgi:signal transduction histidine kinase
LGRGRVTAQVAAIGAVAVMACVLIVLAVRSDGEAFRGQPSLTAMDLAVGIAFVIAPLAARGARWESLLFSLVGLAWLAGSSFAWARSSHQAVLLIALVGFPSGRIRGPAQWAIAAGAVAVVAERVSQLGVVALFGAAAVAVAVRRELAVAAYPAAAASTVAGTVWYSWWTQHLPDKAPSPMVYETGLLAVAVGFPLASAAVVRYRRRLADRVLGDRPVGLGGLQALMGRVLGDETLVIEICDKAFGEFRPVAGPGGERNKAGRVLVAYDGAQPLARMSTTSPAVNDRQTADAAVSILRLAAVNERLNEAHAEQLRELEAARARLVAAADLERARIARELQGSVLAPLHTAANALGTATSTSDGDEVAGFLAVATGELSAVRIDVQRLVDGVPPVELGGGRIVEAIESITMRSVGRVRLSFSGEIVADPDAEAALFYACSEALANAAKHSGSGLVDVDVRRIGDRLVLAVRDRGGGGADPSSSGLQGLADRMAAAGGRLTVDSPVGAGTTVIAEVPA